MEIPDCALEFKNHSETVLNRIEQGSTANEFSATLNDDLCVQESLRRIIAGVSRNAMLQEDLMQEVLVHLWKVERTNPGRTKSWYLQSCQFHVRHWLAAGRSLDSPKRAQLDKRIALDGSDSDAGLPEYHTHGEELEAVSFRDLVSSLAKHLKPREQIVLCGLAEDLSVNEIASRFGISRPTVYKDRRKIAALTTRLGLEISTPRSRRQKNGRSSSLRKNTKSEVRQISTGLASLESAERENLHFVANNRMAAPICEATPTATL